MIKNNSEVYLLPCIETNFPKVSGAKFYAKIDLSNAYWQIPLYEKSQHVCTVNTTRGDFPTSNRRSAQSNGWLRRISRRCWKTWMTSSMRKKLLYPKATWLIGQLNSAREDKRCCFGKTMLSLTNEETQRQLSWTVTEWKKCFAKLELS